MNPDDKARLKNLRRRVNRARRFPENTCSASRHLHLIAERLAAGEKMLIDEPEHCAETMLSVLESLWKARTELDRIRVPNDRVEGRGAALSRRVPSHDGLCHDD